MAGTTVHERGYDVDRRRGGRILATVVSGVVLAAGALVSVPAAAAQQPERRTATVSTFERDAAPSTRQAVKDVRVTQDLTSGRITAVATYRAAPTAAADSVLFVYLGEWSGNACHRRVALAAQAVGTGQAGQFVTGTGPYTSTGALSFTKNLSGATLVFTSAVDARIRKGDWDCAFFDVTEAEPADSSAPVVHQHSEAVDLTEHYAPLLAMDLGEPVQGNYRTKWTKVRIEVRNNSLGPASNVTIRPSGAGLNFKPKQRNLGTIGSRSTKYGVEFRVRLKGKNPKKKQRKATFTATSAGKKFTQRVTIAEKPRPKKVKALAGRYYWGFTPASANKGWDTRALWFVNRKWVHVGFSKNGAKPKCGKKVKACKRYTYNPRTGVVKFGGKKAKVTTEGFAIKAAKADPKIRWYPTTLAKKGQRFNLSLSRDDYTGNCLIFCTVKSESLSMDRKGRFVLGSFSITSLGAPGSNSQFASAPADQKGTYQVQKNGRIVLKYANGTTKRHTLAIEHDVRGKAVAQGAGVVLGDRNFYN